MRSTHIFKYFREYYENLNRFFDKFERIHNLEIIIAANPKSNYNIKEKFIGRKFYKNKTGQLIKNSNLVFAHSSTAVGFAVIYGKPIINLTSNKLKESWIHQEILYSSKVLKTSLINIDIYNSARDSEKLNIEKYDKNSYETYFKTYIKSNKIENMTSWQIFYSYLIEKNLY